MNTFEITIQHKSDKGYLIVVEHSAPGAFLPVRSEGLLELDPTELISLGIDPRAYGQVLGKAVFHDEIRDAFVHARAESAEPLRVLLLIEDQDLRTLRWERLCAPLDREWVLLALDQRTPFSLYLPSLTDQRFPPIGRRDLRALLLVASPANLAEYKLDSFDPTRAKERVSAALGDIPCEVLMPPTLDGLCERITAERYTILHIVCHGRYRKDDGETILYWSNSDNQVDVVTATRLIERLKRLSGARGLPHLAFLSTCESASPEAEGVLGGLAQRLVRELGMPAVVAMTERVSIVTAHALAEKFYARLRAHGEADRALVEATAGIMDRPDVSVAALFSRLGGRPLFGDTLERPLTNAEIRFGLERLQENLDNRAPILREQIRQNTGALALDADPHALSASARTEHESALARICQVCEESLDLGFSALALGQAPPRYDARCPFRGLYSFRVEDREFFFGREALINRLREKLAEHNFLAVLGPSGSGKSSLVLAGLVPALQAECAYLTPGSDPLAALETWLAASRTAPRPPLFVVDQFEELFTLCRDTPKRRAFIARLLALAETTLVVITMRADFWGECAPYRELKEAMQAHQELIAPMDAAELRRAMESQAALVGLRFEADLANQILDDVRGEPGAMPLLQHALLELWKRRHGRWLRAEEYRAIGGVAQAIARSADALYASLNAGEQERVRDIFLRLTRLDEETVQGEERRDTRRRVPIEELTPVGSDPAVAKDLVKRLADARLVVTSVNTATGREEVEVAHEAVIRYWKRLRGWLEDDWKNIVIQRRLTEAARLWDASDHDPSYLADGTRLAEAQRWARANVGRSNRLEDVYLRASLSLSRRRRFQRFAVTFGILPLIVLVLLVAYMTFAEIGPFAQTLYATPVPELQGFQISVLEWASDGKLYAGLGSQQRNGSLSSIPNLVARSEDSGRTWQKLDLPGKQVIAMASDSQHPATLYVSSVEEGLFRSIDSGNHWSAISKPPMTYIDALAVSPSGVVYAGDFDQPVGVYASRDQGATWFPLENAPPTRVYFLGWPRQRLLIGTPNGLAEWSDAGQWRQLINGQVVIRSAAETSEATYAGGNGLYELKGAKSSASFTTESITFIDVDPDDSSRFVASTDTGLVLVWQFDPAQTVPSVRTLQTRWRYLYAVRYHPNDPAKFLIATSDGLYRGEPRRWYEIWKP